jgi:type IV pilus assembly protein PilZ
VSDVPVPRQHVRFPVSLRVDYSTRDAFIANHVSNLSKGGLFIASDAPLPVDSELELVLTLAEPAECIRARGRVIWNYDIRKGTSRVIPGMGIKFLDMSAADRHRLADYLSALRPPTPGAAAGLSAPTQAAPVAVGARSKTL